MTTGINNDRKGPIVFGLALADLLHERILTLNVILALAAIVAPLLIVLGLKEGVIDHLRDNLIQDPVNREIRPQNTQNLEKEWFAAVRKRNDVAFVVPGILRGASIVRVKTPGAKKSEVVDLLPTGPGDPLLLENGAQAPSAGEIVVSTRLAEDLKIQAGDTLRVQASRTVNRKPEVVGLDMTVRSVLGVRGDSLKRIYAPLDFVLDVESYKEGDAVPQRGWTGERPIPFNSYDGAILMVRGSIPMTQRQMLVVGTGFSTIDEMLPKSFADLYGFAPPQDVVLLRLGVLQRAVQQSSIRQIANRLRGHDVLILPFVRSLEFHPESGTPLRVMGYTVAASQANRFGVPQIPWGDTPNNTSFDSLAKVTLPNRASDPPDASIQVTFQGEEQVQFPLDTVGSAPGQVALIPLRLAAMLRTGQDRRIVYSNTEKTLLLERPGFRGFRLYAGKIDDVPKVVADLREQGLETIAKVQEIRGLQNFAAGLDQVFLLVAAVGIIGGISALVASLYAAVERKQRDISVMRLLGLSPNEVFRFPVYQGLLVATLGLVVAFGVLMGVASVLNQVFGPELSGDPAVLLPPELMAIVSALIIFAAFFSSLFAAFRATRIEPAEALRVE